MKLLFQPTKPLPSTPGMLRARIAVRLEFLRQAHPDSAEWWRLQRQLADLERELYALEAPLRPLPARKEADLNGQPF
jgi:hypothetical protein